jgi:hypothetical protein
MKKLGLTALICFTNCIFAIDANFKTRICNYTLSNINYSIDNVAGLTVNDVKYTDFTSKQVDIESIKAIHCQDLPTITASGFNDVPAFMQISIVRNPENPNIPSLNKLLFFNLLARSSSLNPKIMITSFNIRPMNLGNNMRVFIHAINNMSKIPVDYYDTAATGGMDNRGYGYFQNLGNTYTYDFEFYVCDTTQLAPCQHPDNYKYLINNY